MLGKRESTDKDLPGRYNSRSAGARSFPLGGRTLLGDGMPKRKKVPRGKRAKPHPGVQELHVGFAPFGRDIRLENLD